MQLWWGAKIGPRLGDGCCVLFVSTCHLKFLPCGARCHASTNHPEQKSIFSALHTGTDRGSFPRSRPSWVLTTPLQALKAAIHTHPVPTYELPMILSHPVNGFRLNEPACALVKTIHDYSVTITEEARPNRWPHYIILLLDGRGEPYRHPAVECLD